MDQGFSILTTTDTVKSALADGIKYQKMINICRKLQVTDL
jgi:hypothetical protein